MTYYMHTINGLPAEFNKDHLVFTTRKVKLVGSLKKLRDQQRLNSQWLVDKGVVDDCRYGYATLVTP